MNRLYLERYAYPPLSILPAAKPTTELIIVIPVFNERHITISLNSLFESELPPTNTEVLIIINQSEHCDETIRNQNNHTFNEVKNWIGLNQKPHLQFFVTLITLPKKNAGVGLARKAGMDEAVRRFEEINNPKGIILCFDADCICSSNYIKDVYTNFKNKKLTGASINFEHTYHKLAADKKEGIIQYELHLRYYINGLRKAGYPYAFHTIGSSMAVRTDVYVKAGGMNRRKAGEDFHFLHKIIPYGNYDEITTATVFPSARTSNRVPFGTGKAMGDWLHKKETDMITYHPQIFKELKELFKIVPSFYSTPEPQALLKPLSMGIKAYLTQENYEDVLSNIKKQSTNLPTFIHRWFNWLNGLRTLHLVHYLRNNYYASIAVRKAAAQLIEAKEVDTEKLLAHYRALDKDFKADQISLKHLYSGFL